MATNAPRMDDDFLEFESKVNQVLKLLEDMSSANKTDAEDTSKKTKKDLTEEIDEDSFIVNVRQDRTVLSKASAKSVVAQPQQMDKFTFMQQLETDAEERAAARKERERIAQNFRSLGNEAYRKYEFEKAIIMYTKAIEQIKDSPILYNNRALSYIKLKNYKRAIMDCDFVIRKLEEKNLRAWMYRAVCYKRLNDDSNYENSLKYANKHNPKAGVYIEIFLDKLRTGII